MIVPRQHDLGHNVALIAEVLQRTLGAQVVKAIRTRTGVGVRHSAVTMNDAVALLDKLKAHLARRLERKTALGPAHQLHETHETGLTTAHGPRKQNAFSQIDAQLCRPCGIGQEINHQPANDAVVFLVDNKLVAKLLLAMKLQLDQQPGKVIAAYAVTIPPGCFAGRRDVGWRLRGVPRNS